jgi:nucleoprotein TPR
LQISLESTRQEKDELQTLVSNAQVGMFESTEAEQLRAELSSVKAELEATRNQTSTNENKVPTAETVPTSATEMANLSLDQVEAQVAIRRAELEEEYNAKARAAEQQFQARADKMKGSLNNKLRELREKDRETLDGIETKYKAEIEQLKGEHLVEIERLKSEHAQELERLQTSGSTTATQGETAVETSTAVKSEFTDAEIKNLVANNATIKDMIKRNILNTTKKSEEKLREEYEKKIQDATKSAQENAVALEQKRQNVKLNMAEKKTKDALAKIEVVERAATDTPQRPVGEVWAIAKLARQAINNAAAQSAAQSSAGSQAATVPHQNTQGKAAENGLRQSTAPVSANNVPPATAAAPNAQTQANATNASAPTLPQKPAPPQGAGAKVLGGLIAGNPQAGSSIPRFGSNRGRGDGGQGRGGSGIPRGGNRGRGGGQRLSNQASNINTNQAGRGGGGGPQNAGGNSPLNANAKQFTPGGFGGQAGAGNKRPHDDASGQGGNAEKRPRSEQ